MNPAKPGESNTRMIVMGKRPLVECFSLLGFETWTDADEEDLQQVLSDLLESDQKAFLLLESYLSRSTLSILAYVRTHGGRIVVSEIPSLDQTQTFTPHVEEWIKRFGIGD